MNKYPLDYIISKSGTISVFTQGRSYSVTKDHKNYESLVAAVKAQDAIEFLKNVDVIAPIRAVASNIFGGTLEFKDGQFLLNGSFFQHGTTDAIVKLYEQGFNIDRLILFCKNLFQNPNPESIEATYEFLSDKGIPITEDGCFLAWKAVTKDYLDKNSKTIDNHPGQSPFIERDLVDSNIIHNCGYGLHVGNYHYASTFGHFTGDEKSDILLLVKVNPMDVCSVPSDATCEKLRVCKYTVLSVYDTEEGAKALEEADKGGNPAEMGAYETEMNDVRIVPIKTRLPLRDSAGRFQSRNSS